MKLASSRTPTGSGLSAATLLNHFRKCTTFANTRDANVNVLQRDIKTSKFISVDICFLPDVANLGPGGLAK